MRKQDYVIIMAGGIGSRFWPMSRTDFPKQFHDVLGTGKSLIRDTWDRFEGFIPEENILIVTNERYKDLVKSQIPEIKDENLLLEPVGRNTAPCIAYAAEKIFNRDADACLMIAASDHLIMDRRQFLDDIALGLDECRKSDIIMTLGINPVRPDTGYGYIQFIDEENEKPYYKVKTFTEKPNKEMAETFVKSGDFVWNSGMFIFSVKTILSAFSSYMPEMYELFHKSAKTFDTPAETEAIDRIYAQCRNISIDYGIMEKADNVFVIPSDFGWSDLGTWGSMYEHMQKDYLGNAVRGNIMIYDSNNNLVRIENREKLVVVDGCSDLIIIDTDDVLLICPRENEQQIKEIVSDVRKDKGEKFV